MQDCENDALHEGEEDDAFDAQQLGERLVRCQGRAQTGVEADDGQEGDGYGDGANGLEPDVREMRFARCDAEDACALGDVCCDGDEEGDDGVLKDGDPCSLERASISLATQR